MSLDVSLVETRPPLPPFTAETAAQKVRMAEDAWNTRDPATIGEIDEFERELLESHGRRTSPHRSAGTPRRPRGRRAGRWGPPSLRVARTEAGRHGGIL